MEGGDPLGGPASESAFDTDGSSDAPELDLEGSSQLPDTVALPDGFGDVEHYPYEIEDGYVVVGGDMVVGRVDEVFTQTFGFIDKEGRWPNGVIYYEIDMQGKNGFDAPQAIEIEAVIRELDEVSSLDFVEAPNRKERVVIRRWSKTRGRAQVGKDKWGRTQWVKLPGCRLGVMDQDDCDKYENARTDSMIVHELLHAAGFKHEHQRGDAYEGIFTAPMGVAGAQFNKQCVKKGKRGDWKRAKPGFGEELRNIGFYDPASVMHYRPVSSCRIDKNDDDMDGSTTDCRCFPVSMPNDPNDRAPLEDYWERNSRQTAFCARDPSDSSSPGLLPSEFRTACSVSHNDLQSIDYLAAQFSKKKDFKPSVNDGLGHAMASGDFNDDGIDDLVIGVPYATHNPKLGGNEDAGGFGIYMGNPGRKKQSLKKDRPGVLPRQSFGVPFLLCPDRSCDDSTRTGWSVAVGDIDGDRFDDLVVGSPGADGGGAISIYRGYRGGVRLSQVIKNEDLPLQPGDIFGRSDFDEFGYAVDVVDGQILVGAPGAMDPRTSNRCGVGHLFSWAPVDEEMRLEETLESTTGCGGGDELGASVMIMSIGEGESYDYMLGAPGWSDDIGRVNVYQRAYGTNNIGLRRSLYLRDEAGFDCTPENFVPQEADEGARFGHALASRRDDLFIGAPGQRTANGQTGEVQVRRHIGSACYPLSMEVLTANDDPIDQDGALFGWSLEVADFDANNGGIAIGAPGISNGGAAYVFRGKSIFGGSYALLDTLVPGDGDDDLGANARYGHALAAGDFDGAQSPNMSATHHVVDVDLAIGAPGADIKKANDGVVALWSQATSNAALSYWRKINFRTRTPYAK